MNEPKRFYLAGPIRGVADYRAKFEYAANLLRHRGYFIFNPVEQDDLLERSGTPMNIAEFLELDLRWILRHAHGVALLPGWQNSTGAQAEYWTAKAAGKETWELPVEYWL